MVEILGGGMGTARAGSSAHVIDGSQNTFMEDVIEASQTVPVIVDFWATWCGPCKTLGPILEKVVAEQNGKVRMVKIDVDQNQALASQLRIQSVPTVYGFKGGRPVDGFGGMIKESEIRAFVNRLVGEGESLEDLLKTAKELAEEGDHDNAIAAFQDILGEDPTFGPAMAGLLKSMLVLHGAEIVAEAIQSLEPVLADHPEVKAIATQLELAAKAAEKAGALGQFQDRLAKDPNDHEARLELGLALFGMGNQWEGIEELLEIFRRDRGWNDDAARKELLRLFEALGPTDPLTLKGRRRLSSLMFS